MTGALYDRYVVFDGEAAVKYTNIQKLEIVMTPFDDQLRIVSSAANTFIDGT